MKVYMVADILIKADIIDGLGNNSMGSCQKGPTCHGYAWRIGPFWQDTLELLYDMYWRGIVGLRYLVIDPRQQQILPIDVVLAEIVFLAGAAVDRILSCPVPFTPSLCVMKYWISHITNRFISQPYLR